MSKITRIHTPSPLTTEGASTDVVEMPAGLSVVTYSELDKAVSLAQRQWLMAQENVSMRSNSPGARILRRIRRSMSGKINRRPQ